MMLPGHTAPSSSHSAGDGKEGSDSTGKLTKKKSPNYSASYIYYRLYTKLGALESNHSIYSNDRFIGRRPSKSFAPPHTVASIKRYLCKFEGLSEPEKALIFIPLSSPTPEEDSAFLSLFASSGPGLSEQDPIVLLAESDKRSTNIRQSGDLPERTEDGDARFVHYRVYSSEGDEKAKTSFDESDDSLGRINTLFVAPPHTIGSLKACIAKIEGLVTPNYTSLYQDLQLFEHLDSKAAMSDTDVLSFLGDGYPGSDEGDPIALVSAIANTSTNKTQAAAEHTSSEATFTKHIRSLFTHDYPRERPSWLSITKGEIMCTDGILVTDDGFPGHIAIDSKGKKGFVATADMVYV